MSLDKHGREVPDPRPVEWPANLKRPLTLQEEIQRFVRVEMSQRAAEHGMESFEEADDFDVGDEDEWQSPYEMTEMQEETPPPTAEPVQGVNREGAPAGVSPSDPKTSSVSVTEGTQEGNPPSTIPKT